MRCRRCGRPQPTAAPGLAHIRAGTRPHLRTRPSWGVGRTAAPGPSAFGVCAAQRGRTCSAPRRFSPGMARSKRRLVRYNTPAAKAHWGPMRDHNVCACVNACVCVCVCVCEFVGTCACVCDAIAIMLLVGIRRSERRWMEPRAHPATGAKSGPTAHSTTQRGPGRAGGVGAIGVPGACGRQGHLRDRHRRSATQQLPAGSPAGATPPADGHTGCNVARLRVRATCCSVAQRAATSRNALQHRAAVAAGHIRSGLADGAR
jgi:hypothetical protein